MATLEGASAVIQNLDGKEIKGRKVHIEKMQNDPTLKTGKDGKGKGEKFPEEGTTENGKDAKSEKVV